MNLSLILALILAAVLSTGGAGEVVGPANTSIADRNQLAVVMLMTIPLANYLRLTSANRVVRAGLVLVMLLNAVAVLGTFSRGGLIGLRHPDGCDRILHALLHVRRARLGAGHGRQQRDGWSDECGRNRGTCHDSAPALSNAHVGRLSYAVFRRDIR